MDVYACAFVIHVMMYIVIDLLMSSMYISFYYEVLQIQKASKVRLYSLFKLRNIRVLCCIV